MLGPQVPIVGIGGHPRMLVQDLGCPCRLDLPSLPPSLPPDGYFLGDRMASLGAGFTWGMGLGSPGASPGFWGALVRYALAGQSAASALECGLPGRLASQGKGKTALGNGLLASQLAA